jgi:hypothetical protein
MGECPVENIHFTQGRGESTWKQYAFCRKEGTVEREFKGRNGEEMEKREQEKV